MSIMSSGEALSSCQVVTAGAIAKYIQSELANGLSELKKAPLLVGFLANKVQVKTGDIIPTYF